MTMFRYSTLGGGENAPVPSAAELIEVVRRGPVWAEITITREDDAQFPRAQYVLARKSRLGPSLFRGRTLVGRFPCRIRVTGRTGNRHRSWRPGSGAVAATVVR